MDNIELQTKHYKERLISYGPSLEALGWHSKISQDIRFDILSSIGDLNGHNVLDVGCGFGDLYGYLREESIMPRDYLGIDLVEGMIKEADKRYPEADFEVSSILDPVIGYYDYVLASGIFGLKSLTWDSYVQSMLNRMFEICRIGVGANFLLAGGVEDPVSHYADPNVMVDLAREISPKVRCRLGYKINDFTLFMYR